MSPLLVLIVILFYFGLILVISQLTARKADNETFFLGNRRSPWYVVAFGMIGTSLSGVTFISVPGWVGTSQFGYMQMVLGYLLGYFICAQILLPLYYRLNLTSIYTYLEGRFGFSSYKTGAAFFLLSRGIGASFRLYLMASVLHISIFGNWNIPFWVTVVITILLIWLYTFRGGIKTIIWTDTLQTLFMLLAVIITIIVVTGIMDLDFAGMVKTVKQSDYSRIFFFSDWRADNHFVKQFFAGVFIAIVMTGLDQDMMQKNLTCRSLKDAQKNMYWMSLSLGPVNFSFLFLGALLYLFAVQNGLSLPAQTDDLFPMIATRGYLPGIVTMFFMVGLVAAAYSSADSALTALTTSFTVDILDGSKLSEEKLKKLRKRVHMAISLIILVIIMIFRAINDQTVIAAIFTVAGYTYGPILGLYSFGLFTKFKVKDRWVPVVAIASPILCYIISSNSEALLNGYNFGFELLILNGLLTFIGLLIIRRRQTA